MKKLQGLYKKSDQILNSGKFGTGLWPVDPFLGQFLSELIQRYDLKKGIEVGAGVGYSTAWIASGFQVTGGDLVTFEYFLPKVQQWEKHMKALFGNGFESFLHLVPSDFRKWTRHKGKAKYDFVFMDHRKNEYVECLQTLLPLLKKGAFICADNVTSHPRECAEYLNLVKNDKRFESVTLELGQGLEVTRWLAG